MLLYSQVFPGQTAELHLRHIWWRSSNQQTLQIKQNSSTHITAELVCLEHWKHWNGPACWHHCAKFAAKLWHCSPLSLSSFTINMTTPHTDADRVLVLNRPLTVVLVRITCDDASIWVKTSKRFLHMTPSAEWTDSVVKLELQKKTFVLSLNHITCLPCGYLKRDLLRQQHVTWWGGDDHLSLNYVNKDCTCEFSGNRKGQWTFQSGLLKIWYK